MATTQADEHSRFKLAQLWHIVNSRFQHQRKTYLHDRVVNEILKDGFNFNYKVTVNPNPWKSSELDLKDCTALHFLYYDVYDLSTFTTLVDRGADYTLKNGNGQSVLHMIMTQYQKFDSEKQLPFMNAILSAHVKFENPLNPCDNNGLSHLHGACIANHVEAVGWFLANGASVDDAVNVNSPHYAGYTPLHFAAEFRSFEVAQILLSHGASVNATDTQVRSPLDLLISKKSGVLSSQEEIFKRDQMIKLLLEKNAVSTVGLSRLHIACTLEDLTIAKTLLEQVTDIDHAVPSTSPVCLGYTALHFAADNSIEAVKMLLSRTTKIDITNAEGLTPLDFCLDRYSLAELSDILSCVESFQEIRLSDGETRLLDLIPSMKNVDEFKIFLQNNSKAITGVISGESVLWPGYTILHLAVTFSEKVGYDTENFEAKFDKTIVEECLNHGMSLNVQDVKGRTPTHLAFIEGKFDLLNLLLEHLNRLGDLTNVVDEDNLSYLHIACEMENESLVEKLLSLSDANIAYKGKTMLGDFAEGTTPLHIAANRGSDIIADMLLRHGADLHATDANKMTPIHHLLHEGTYGNDVNDLEIANVLFDSLLADPRDRVVDGLSYLHVACYFGNVDAAEKLLDLGSDVNAVVKCDEKPDNDDAGSFVGFFSNFTPLQMAIKNAEPNYDVLDLLLSRGADMFVKGSNRMCVSPSRSIPLKNRRAVMCFFEVLWDENDLQKRVEEKLGLTRLHIACYRKVEEDVKSALNDGIDVNGRMHADSVIFAGCTPLHLLMDIVNSDDPTNVLRQDFTVGNAINLLVDRGADVTMANTEKETPVHVFWRNRGAFIDADRCKTLLLNAQKNFNTNPTNTDRLSHFHLACHWQELKIVENFLQHNSVNVNEPIDYFARDDAGCTPLHLTLSKRMWPNADWTKLSQLIDLLLKHGANVAAKDVYGETPLHKPAVLQSPEMSILDKLVNYGGDIKSKNIKGQTPIDMWPGNLVVNINSPDYVTVFKKYNYKINSWNHLTGEGHVGKIFLLNHEKLSESSRFEEFVKSTDARSVDDTGRTAIHNSVAHSELYVGKTKNYIYAIESFVKIGVDIDHQDKSGQTALHYAARMENAVGVEALLSCGADVNTVDNCGKSAFSYAVEHSEKRRDLCFSLNPTVTLVLRLHMKKLQNLGIEVSQLNQNLFNKIQHFFDDEFPRFTGDANLIKLSQKFSSQIEMAKTLDIGVDSLTLHNFLPDTGAVNLYSLLPKSERDVVDKFFNSIDFDQWDELTGLIKLQFKKMTTRLGLIDSALSCLRTLLGFSVPNLCEQISRFLSNSDLKNLIESTSLKTRKRKLSEMTV